MRTGLVSVDKDGDSTVVSRLNRIATLPGDASLDVHRMLLAPSSPSELGWSEFDHIAPERGHVERLRAGALSNRAQSDG